MDSEKIDKLLARYWNCETSLEEEEQLRGYFSGDVPEQHAEAANMFRYFHEQKKKSLTDISFDGRLMKKIRTSHKGKVTSLAFNTMRIAAGIAVLIAAVWLVRMEVRESNPAEMADTYDDPRMAFEETKKALMMISKSFGTAEEQAKKINLFNEAQKNIRKDEQSKPEL
jgi:hypothetical protein